MNANICSSVRNLAAAVVCTGALGAASIGLAGIACASSAEVTGPTTVGGPQNVPVTERTMTPAPRQRIAPDPFMVTNGGR